jgi:hypothetical protein
MSILIRNTNKDEAIKLFYSIFKYIKALRREYPKGHNHNLLYKEVGNSIYVKVVRGLSNKKCFDSLTGKNVRVIGASLSNQNLASGTTAFIT